MDDVVPIPDFLKGQLHRPSLRPALVAGQSPSPNVISTFEVGSQSAPDCPEFIGVRVFHDFLSKVEEIELLKEIETEKFVKAQSGKLKQHFGPKINFNKKKMNADHFRGIPAYAARFENRMRALVEDQTQSGARDQMGFAEALASFEVTDVFVLQYFAPELSNLDFHLDDTFAYGELILDLSLESDSVLTFLRKSRTRQASPEDCVRVPLPARSLAVVYGAARFEWEHAILSDDITGRRTSITLRTLHENLRQTEAGERVINIARSARALSTGSVRVADRR